MAPMLCAFDEVEGHDLLPPSNLPARQFFAMPPRSRRSFHLMHAATTKSSVGNQEIIDFVKADSLPDMRKMRLDL